MRIAKMSLFLAALLPILSHAGKSERIPLPNELKGKEIPNFFVLAKDNTEELYKDDIKQAAKKAGAKRIVLSFFATYCVSCKEEFATLKKNKDELKKQGVLVYFVNVGESIHTFGAKAEEMVVSNAGDSFPYYFDPNAILPKSFGLAKQGEDLGLPMTVILDSDLRALGVLRGKMGDDFPKVLWSEL